MNGKLYEKIEASALWSSIRTCPLCLQNSTLSDVKVLLREAAEREHKLIRENNDMEKKVS